MVNCYGGRLQGVVATIYYGGERLRRRQIVIIVDCRGSSGGEVHHILHRQEFQMGRAPVWFREVRPIRTETVRPFFRSPLCSAALASQPRQINRHGKMKAARDGHRIRRRQTSCLPGRRCLIEYSFAFHSFGPDRPVARVEQARSEI
jgi:hypothetical protein